MGMPSVYAVGAINSSTGAVLVGMPTGTITNDILCMFLENQDASGVPATAGWTDIVAPFASTGTPTRLTARWKRAGPSEGAVTVADPGDHLIARVVGIRGCVTGGNPYNTTSSTTELTSDTSVSVPGSTTTAPQCLILAGFSTGTDLGANSTTHASAFANASLASLTARVNDWRIDGLGGGMAVVSGELAVAGAYGATTATVATANFKALLSIAFQGATGKSLEPKRHPSYRR